MPVPPPPPPRPALVLLGLVALGCAGLVLFTSHKLYVMAELRGDIEGIPTRELVVQEQVQRFSDGAGVYVLADPAVPKVTWHTQFTREQAAMHRAGSSIVVRCIDEEQACYTRESVYVDDGNRSFDLGLLAVETLGLLASLVGLYLRWSRWRAEVRALTPPWAS